MNAVVHSESSIKRYRGELEDYYQLHDFMDSSKEIESTNKHRCAYHTVFSIKQFLIPIFGHTILNSDGTKVNVKDCAEFHILEDYHNRFIPTLADFIEAVDDSKDDKDLISQFDLENRAFYKVYPEVREVMISPLMNTGKLKSLLLTHNSWFVMAVLPKIFINVKIELKDFNISPSVLFNRMEFKEWMNGRGTPLSFAKIDKKRKEKVLSFPGFKESIIEDLKENIRGRLLD